ncbi:MAG: hypothetical protein ACRDD4_12145 [Culicoidibacterales bacterium]
MDKKIKKSDRGIHKFRNEISKIGSNITKTSTAMTKNISVNIGQVDFFNTKLRKQAVFDYNTVVEQYEQIATIFEKNAQELYNLRKMAIIHLKYVEHHINLLSNTPKEFVVELQEIHLQILTFESKEKEIYEAEQQVKAAAGGGGAGATLGALGIAVATMGPTAAMGIATTFGVASTGTAISALSGAAANSAALAWLGGGALAAGGGGMSAGTALLALAGPVGWTIAGVAGAASIGSGIYANIKNKKVATQLLAERQNLETIKSKFMQLNLEIEALIEATETQIIGVQTAKDAVIGTDYSKFTADEKVRAGFLVNTTLILAQLINKELKLND